MERGGNRNDSLPGIVRAESVSAGHGCVTLLCLLLPRDVYDLVLVESLSISSRAGPRYLRGQTRQACRGRACGQPRSWPDGKSESMLILQTSIFAALRSSSLGNTDGIGKLAAIFVDGLDIFLQEPMTKPWSTMGKSGSFFPRPEHVERQGRGHEASCLRITRALFGSELVSAVRCTDRDSEAVDAGTCHEVNHLPLGRYRYDGRWRLHPRRPRALRVLLRQ